VRTLTPQLAAFVSILWLPVAYLTAWAITRKLRLYRKNFLGLEVETAAGLFIVLWAPLSILLFASAGYLELRQSTAFLAAIVGFGAFGFLDDLLGDRSVGGLRGHFRKLFVESKITTGLIKAVGGSAVGVAIARFVFGSSWPESTLNGAIIALSANALNLFDLRPGRACAVFFAVSAGLLGISLITSETLSPLWFVVIPTLIVWRRDCRGQAMMGDTGSNLLGASIGLAAVFAAKPLFARLAILGTLTALHIVAERISITDVIERNVLLKRIDSWTGRRT
jgi:UDP-GlcNAc:undecaprenyl-phosphate GlcNAc-1-phosphate transferase